MIDALEPARPGPKLPRFRRLCALVSNGVRFNWRMTHRGHHALEFRSSNHPARTCRSILSRRCPNTWFRRRRALSSDRILARKQHRCRPLRRRRQLSSARSRCSKERDFARVSCVSFVTASSSLPSWPHPAPRGGSSRSHRLRRHRPPRRRRHRLLPQPRNHKPNRLNPRRRPAPIRTSSMYIMARPSPARSR